MSTARNDGVGRLTIFEPGVLGHLETGDYEGGVTWGRERNDPSLRFRVPYTMEG